MYPVKEWHKFVVLLIQFSDRKTQSIYKKMLSFQLDWKSWKLEPTAQVKSTVAVGTYCSHDDNYLTAVWIRHFFYRPLYILYINLNCFLFVCYHLLTKRFFFFINNIYIVIGLIYFGWEFFQSSNICKRSEFIFFFAFIFLSVSLFAYSFSPGCSAPCAASCPAPCSSCLALCAGRPAPCARCLELRDSCLATQAFCLTP